MGAVSSSNLRESSLVTDYGTHSSHLNHLHSVCNTNTIKSQYTSFNANSHLSFDDELASVKNPGYSKKSKKFNKIFKFISSTGHSNESNSADLVSIGTFNKRDESKTKNRKKNNFITKSLIFVSTNKQDGIKDRSNLSTFRSSGSTSLLDAKFAQSSTKSNRSSSGCSSGASSGNLSISRRLNLNQIQENEQIKSEALLKPNNISPLLTSSSTHSVLSSSCYLKDSTKCSTPIGNLPYLTPRSMANYRNSSYLHGLNTSKPDYDLISSSTKNYECDYPGSASNLTESKSNSLSNYLKPNETRASNRKTDSFMDKSKSMYVEDFDMEKKCEENFKVKKNHFKNRFSLKSNKSKKADKLNKHRERDSGIISDFFNLGSMSNLKSKINNATESLRNSFSVFSLKPSLHDSSCPSAYSSQSLSKNVIENQDFKKKRKSFQSIF